MNPSPPPMGPLSNPPRPRLSWVAAGGLLALIGLVLLPTMVLTGIGIFLIIAGGTLIVAGFLSKRGRGLRTEHEANRSHGRHRPTP